MYLTISMKRQLVFECADKLRVQIPTHALQYE